MTFLPSLFLPRVEIPDFLVIADGFRIPILVTFLWSSSVTSLNVMSKTELRAGFVGHVFLTPRNDCCHSVQTGPASLGYILHMTAKGDLK